VPVKIPAAGEDEKFVVFGALDYATGQLVIQSCPRKGEEAFAAFLETLVATLPPDAPVVLVLDNVGYHKSHALRTQWQRIADHVKPFWLPAYAPQINLMERVWRFLKQQLSCHRWWNDLDRLQQATATLLTHLEVHFHTENGPAFHLAHNLYQSA
jgi:transposase